VKIKLLERVLGVVMLSILAAQDVSRAQEPVSEGTPAQTLFAYKNSFRARLGDALFGDSGLPSDVPVELAPVDPSSLEHATINSTVTFRVVRDVVEGPYAYPHEGMLIEAKVTRIREGKLRIRRGRMEPRVIEVTVPEGIVAPESMKMTLESSPRSRSSRTAKQLATLPLTIIHLVVVVPAEWVLLGIACATGCDL